MPTTIFRDSFTDTAGTLLTAHTSDSGHTYSAQGSGGCAPRISSSGTLYDGANLSQDLVASVALPSQFTLSYTLKCKSLDSQSENAVALLNASGAGYRFGYFYYPGSSAWYLQEQTSHTSGPTASLAQYSSPAPVAGGSNAVTVSDNAGTFLFSVDGTPIIGLTNTDYTPTAFALVSPSGGTVGGDTTGFHLDDVAITTPSGGGLTAGAATAGAATATTAAATAADASGGTAPYSYQWYRSTASGTLGAAVAGQTTRTLADAGLTRGVTYYYTLRYTDSAGTPAVVSSNQISILTPTNQVIGLGNSIMFGTGTSSPATQSPIAQLAALLGPSWSATDLGYAGYTSEQLASVAPSAVYPLLSPGYARNAIIWYEGTNSLANTSDTASQAYAVAASVFSGLRTAAASAGAPIEVRTNATMPIAASYTQFQAKIAAYNALVLANSAGADRAINLPADPRLNDPTNATYFAGDQIHPNTAGSGIMATAWYFDLLGVLPVPASGGAPRIGKALIG